VLAWRQRVGEPAGIEALWRRLLALGWAPDAARVVVTVGQTWRSPAVLDVARTIARGLRDTGCQVTAADPAAAPGEWEGFVLAAPAREDAVLVTGIAVPGPLAVPRLWFTAHAAVLVCGAGPSPVDRLAAALAAEAETLRAAGNAYAPEALAYEAHRLAAPDLVVVAGRDGGELWCIASPSDAAAESAVGRAAGLDAGRLPALRALARHEVLGPPGELEGQLPRLAALAAPAGRAALVRLAWQVRSGVRRAVHDAGMFRRNLRKIPGFVRRRLARGGAA
jgi:hypothetical protein